MAWSSVIEKLRSRLIGLLFCWVRCEKMEWSQDEPCEVPMRGEGQLELLEWA